MARDNDGKAGAPGTSGGAVLQLDDLHVSFRTERGTVDAVRGVSLEVRRGECVAIVGESGSGKSQTFLAAMRLLAPNGFVSGTARFRGEDLLSMDLDRLNRRRGSRIGMVFQDPLSSLTPHIAVGEQIAEPLRRHLCLTRREARDRACEWLERVRIPDVARRYRQYPHELSGGMRQRVMIAGAMAAGPDLLIADEPTTALDATVQAEILDLMRELIDETGTALALITHDMGVVARLADHVCVMREGLIVEGGTVDDIFARPRETYTRRLLDAVSRSGRARVTASSAVPASAPRVLDVRDLKVDFALRGGLFAATTRLRALDGVDLALRAGETLGIVGESGSGKSTLAMAILQLVSPSGGSVSLLGRDLARLGRQSLQAARRDMQIVFQDPFSSLDPRIPVGDSIAEPLYVHRPRIRTAERDRLVEKALARVNLAANLAARYPHELSGGQNQRVCIARATILEPRLLICDEAVSALDATIRAQIIDLLADLQRDLGMAMLFISHDLAAVREISHRIMVLYLGRTMETGPADSLFERPHHPYTRALLAAAPTADPGQRHEKRPSGLASEPFSPLDPDAVLRFMPSRRGSGYRPKLVEVAPTHWVAEYEDEERGDLARSTRGR